MSTAKETEARIRATMTHINASVKDMTKRIDAMVARLNKVESRAIAEVNLKDAFKKNEKVSHYTWTYERAYENRTCFTTQELIFFGTKAYKGTKKILTNDAPDPYFEFLPDVMWLTKEEFTLRRLQGQI